MKLQGIFPPITTPFDHAGNIYAAKLQHNIEKWNTTGLAGYAVVASTGESVMLDTGEKIQLWEWVAQWAAPEKLLELLAGQVWQWIVPSTELPALKQKHIVSGTVRRADGIQVRVVSDSAPAPEAQPSAASLEDVYLQLVSKEGSRA